MHKWMEPRGGLTAPLCRGDLSLLPLLCFLLSCTVRGVLFFTVTMGGEGCSQPWGPQWSPCPCVLSGGHPQSALSSACPRATGRSLKQSPPVSAPTPAPRFAQTTSHFLVQMILRRVWKHRCTHSPECRAPGRQSPGPRAQCEGRGRPQACAGGQGLSLHLFLLTWGWSLEGGAPPAPVAGA